LVRFLLAALVFTSVSAHAETGATTAEPQGWQDLVAPETPPWNTIAHRVVHTFSGVQYVVLKEGSGPKPVRDQVVQLHYEARLPDGTVFDSSYRRNQAYNCRVGIGFLIPGWDEMAMDMRTGERRVAKIPPELAYGKEGFPGQIPPNATLTLDVVMVGMEPVDF
jgi:FKBP-type peptidyl-prolyl cis-trans isomerase